MVTTLSRPLRLFTHQRKVESLRVHVCQQQAGHSLCDMGSPNFQLLQKAQLKAWNCQSRQLYRTCLHLSCLEGPCPKHDMRHSSVGEDTGWHLTLCVKCKRDLCIFDYICLL